VTHNDEKDQLHACLVNIPGAGGQETRGRGRRGRAGTAARGISQRGHTWADWVRALAWAGMGNLIGGIGLVTSIRLLQVPHRVAEERGSTATPE
jgi:hypothetical protein